MQPVNYKSGITGDSLVKDGYAKYWGYTVNVATATANIDIRNAVAAAGGDIIDTIPSGKAVGSYMLPAPISCDAGIFVDYGATATGTITLLYE